MAENRGFGGSGETGGRRSPGPQGFQPRGTEEDRSPVSTPADKPDAMKCARKRTNRGTVESVSPAMAELQGEGVRW